MRQINSYLLITVILLFQSSVSLFAQERVIQGKVTAFESIPVMGANVKVKSTKQVVQTDTSGFFTVMCNPKDQITISAKGFYKQKVKLGESIKLVLVDLKFVENKKNVEYAIGYGHIKEEDRITAMSRLTAQEHDFSKYSNMQDLLQGKFPGVQVSGNNINIRGAASLTSGTAPLVIIDGTNSNQEYLFSLSPSVVYSINIIKDGSTAIYGARGANGVVIVETKTGRE
ncbi:TonB-dependent receptor plug domain-containing protein [Bacteroidota bacterium]